MNELQYPFFTGILYHTGSPALSILLWLLCGLYALLGALCYAELGTTIPKSGGDYIYIYEAFGSLPAFIFLWIALVIVNPTSLAVIALTFAQYCLKPFFPNSEVPDESARLLAAWCILALTFINCYNVRLSTRIQDILALSKIFALGMIVFAAIIYLAQGHLEHVTIEKLTENSNTGPIGIALAFYSGIFSYSGFNYLNFITEEIKEPNKNLPKAIYISLPIVTLVYILVNMGYFCALSTSEILNSDAVAVTFAHRAMGPFAFLVPIFVAFACIGSLNGIIFTCSRMFFAGARNGHLPELMAMINIHNYTPMPSLIFLGSTSLIMLFIKDIYILINYLAFSECAIVTMAVAAHFTHFIQGLLLCVPGETPQ
uniref:Amino acid transporter n=1 Tax=Panagrolaimus superbus TaxID=310955 RepID=A0A914Y4M8_9BILA